MFRDCESLTVECNVQYMTPIPIVAHNISWSHFSLSSCFVFDPAVFLGAFLGPIFAVLLFNIVIFIMVIRVLIKHTWSAHGNAKEQMNKKVAIRLLVSIASVMFLFGLTWLFGAFTVVGFGDARASTAFQVLFVILNAFQGFFIFLFFCVFSRDARDAWLELLSCGRYQSKSLHRSQTRYTSSRSVSFRKTTSVTNSDFTSASEFNRSEHNMNTDHHSMKEVTAAHQPKQNHSFKKIPEIPETDISMDEKVDLKSPEMEKDQVLEKIHKHTGENCAEVDVLEGKNDDSDSK